MSTLIKSNKKNQIVQWVRKNLDLFESFEKAYLFGSLVNGVREPKDVDILLIYRSYSDKLLLDVEKLRTLLKEFCELTIDLTVLSESEEKETNFISRLGLNCLMLM